MRPPRTFSVPMLFGPLRGLWWDLASGGKVTRLLLGSYEREQSTLFRRLVRPGDQVLDIGASTGYYTLLAARCVGPTGSVIAFEPDVENLRFLRMNRLRNRLAQTNLLPIALGDNDTTVSFGGGSGTGTRRICSEGATQVQVRRLDALADELDLHPQHVKIDVEGHEEAVLRGGEQIFTRYHPTIFLSTHEWLRPGMHNACCQLLRSWGYTLQPIGGSSVAEASELLCVHAAVQALSA